MPENSTHKCTNAVNKVHPITNSSHMANILSVYNRLQAGDYENGNGGKRRVSRLTQFIHATLHLLSCLLWATASSESHSPASIISGAWNQSPDCGDSGGTRVFATLGQRSVVPPLQPATYILSALNKLKININIRWHIAMQKPKSKFRYLKRRHCKVSPGAAALPRPPSLRHCKQVSRPPQQIATTVSETEKSWNRPLT